MFNLCAGAGKMPVPRKLFMAKLVMLPEASGFYDTHTLTQP
jgi:hypothetical protein